jgi:phosphoribosylaminoimidazole (AIR) synthetase
MNSYRTEVHIGLEVLAVSSGKAHERVKGRMEVLSENINLALSHPSVKLESLVQGMQAKSVSDRHKAAGTYLTAIGMCAVVEARSPQRALETLEGLTGKLWDHLRAALTDTEIKVTAIRFPGSPRKLWEPGKD